MRHYKIKGLSFREDTNNKQANYPGDGHGEEDEV